MSPVGIGRDKNRVCNLRVMSDERSDFSVCTSQGDTPIDPAGEIGEAILEIMMGNLHNVWGVGIAQVTSWSESSAAKEGLNGI